MRRTSGAILAFGMLVTCTLGSWLAVADGPPPRELASPAARKLAAGDAAEYWDLTVELDQGYRVISRFLITNQGPGAQSGIAVGHVISPDGRVTQFRNGRLANRWTLSEDGLDLDIGKSHLDLHSPVYRLKVNKPEARIRLSFAPNALYRLPKKLVSKDYRIDLLALGAAARGTLRVDEMTEPLAVEGRATLTHTIAGQAETELALRRIELTYQQGDFPLYIAEFLGPAGKRSRWLGYLEPGCDAAFRPRGLFPGVPNPAGLVQKSSGASDETCLRALRSLSAFNLALGEAIQPSSKDKSKRSYWIPYILDLKGTAAAGRVTLGERFLRHDPLDDLPGPIRFLAGLSTKPRRVWSPASFEVTIRPSLNSKPILFQGQGVATVSFLNPVTRP